MHIHLVIMQKFLRGGEDLNKRIISLILPLTFAFAAAGCTVNSVSDGDFYQKGLNLVGKMDDMAECDDYITLLSSSQDMNSIIKEIGGNDYSKPKAVYKVTVTTEEIDSIFLGEAGEDVDLPSEILSEARKRLVLSFPSRINAMEGAYAVASTSILTTSESFISNAGEDCSLYFYIYDGGYSACVTFVPGENNITSATGYFIINDDLSNVASQDEFSQWLFDITRLIDIEVEDVSESTETK